MLQREHSAILSTFIKLSIVIKMIVLSIFEWSFYTGFTVHVQNILTAKFVIYHNTASVYRVHILNTHFLTLPID